MSETIAQAIDTSFLRKLGIRSQNLGVSTGQEWIGSGNQKFIASHSPVDGQLIGKVKPATRQDYDAVMEKATAAFEVWRMMPAPKRGEIVRQYGNKLREYKDALGRLVSYEMGKSLQEGWGEVQEMIDICDFAVWFVASVVWFNYALGAPFAPHVRAMAPAWSGWYYLGVLIFRWLFGRGMLPWRGFAAMCVSGNRRRKHPLSAIACQNIFAQVLKENNLPEGISGLVIGDYKVGEYLSGDERVPLVSATGSTRMGKIVAQNVAARLGRSLLELGGNNAIIITETADLNITVVGATFGAVGTCGQRCTSTRRLIIHKSVYDVVKNAIAKAYTQLRIGNPLRNTQSCWTAY
jgi:aldehyde dehydrogenase (NAD+)